MKLLTYDYDRSYDPAMPIVEVHLASIDSSESIGPVTAIVDSAADGTMVPVDLLEQIGALSVESGIVRGIWGERRPVKIYLLPWILAKWGRA